MYVAAVLASSGAALAACSTAEDVVAIDQTSLYALVQTVDGTYFGPPLGPEVVPTGPFDATLLTQLQVVLEAESSAGVVQRLGAFDSRTTPRLSLLGTWELYFVNVPAASYFTDPTLSYRFRAFLGGREIGRADLATAKIFEVMRWVPTVPVGVKLRIERRPVPAVSSLSPAAIAVGLGTTVTVNGAGFVHDSVVRMDGSDLETSWRSQAVLTAFVPAARIGEVGSRRVTVFTPTSGGGTSDALPLSVEVLCPDEGCLCFADVACYTGAAGTADVGVCRAGARSCTNSRLGPCVGEILPAAEVCNEADDDCDGQVDNGVCVSDVGAWSDPIASSAEVFPAGDRLEQSPYDPTYDPTTGLYTGRVTTLAEGRMVRLTGSRVAIVTEQQMNSPLADNTYRFHFAFLSDPGAGTYAEVTSPDQRPVLAESYASAGGWDPGSSNYLARIDSSPCCNFYMNGYGGSNGTAADFDTVAHLAEHMTAVDRSVSLATSRPLSGPSGISIGYFTVNYVPDIGEVLTFRAVARNPDGTFSTSVTSSVRELAPGAVTWYPYFNDNVEAGDWGTATFGPAARTYTANPDGTLTISVRYEHRALARLSAEEWYPNTSLWNSFGLTVSEVERLQSSALAPPPAGTESDWDEGLVTLFDVPENNHLREAGSVWLYEPNIENMQMIAMESGQYLLYATDTETRDSHFSDDHMHVGLIHVDADGRMRVVSRIPLVDVPDMADMGYYSTTVQKVSETDAVVFWTMEQHAQNADGRNVTKFVFSHVRITDGALSLVGHQYFDAPSLADAELQAAIPGYVSAADAIAEMATAVGEDSSGVPTSDGGTAPSLIDFATQALSEASGYYSTDAYFQARSGTTYGRSFQAMIFRDGRPDAACESSTRLPDGRAVFLGSARSYGTDVSFNETAYVSGTPSREYSYHLSAEHNFVFVAELAPDGAVRIVQSPGWSRLEFRYQWSRSIFYEAVDSRAFADFSSGNSVDLWGGGLVGSERGVLVQREDLAVSGGWGKPGITGMTIDAAGVASLSPPAEFLSSRLPPNTGVAAYGSAPLAYMGRDQFAGVYFVQSEGDGPATLSLLTVTWDGHAPVATNVVPLLTPAGQPYQAGYRTAVEQAALDGHRLVFATTYSALLSGEPTDTTEAWRTDATVIGVLSR